MVICFSWYGKQDCQYYICAYIPTYVRMNIHMRCTIHVSTRQKKLTTTLVKSSSIHFYLSLFLRTTYIRCPWVLRWSLNGSVLPGQADKKKITTQLASVTGHWFSYIHFVIWAQRALLLGWFLWYTSIQMLCLLTIPTIAAI